MNLHESDTWKYLFNSIREKYFEQWTLSQSIDQREQIFLKLNVLKDIEHELIEIKARSIISFNTNELLES